IAISDEILMKPGKLTEEEWVIVKRHPEVGYNISGSSPLLEPIADAYDVMTHDRPYKKAVSKKEALEELERCTGTQFDSNLVKKFINFIKKNKLILK
ncbi:MAG: hypothetical protein HQ569_10015, partial [Actinobacteria bacterium]|nr:hypothetical protein [Actinomycetota bacterium]